MCRYLGLAVFGSMILSPWFAPGGEKLRFVELEAPRFDGGTLDNHVLPWLNTRFSVFNSDGSLVAATCGSQVFIWKVPDGELLWRTSLPLRETPRMVNNRVASVALHGHQVSFSPGGKWFAVSTFHPPHVCFWNVASIVAESNDTEPLILDPTAIAKATPGNWLQGGSCPQLFWQSEEDAIVYITGDLYAVQVSDAVRLRPYVSVKPNYWIDMALESRADGGLSMIGVNIAQYRDGSMATIFHNRAVISQIEAWDSHNTRHSPT